MYTRPKHLTAAAMASTEKFQGADPRPFSPPRLADIGAHMQRGPVSAAVILQQLAVQRPSAPQHCRVPVQGRCKASMETAPAGSSAGWAAQHPCNPCSHCHQVLTSQLQAPLVATVFKLLQACWHKDYLVRSMYSTCCLDPNERACSRACHGVFKLVAHPVCRSATCRAALNASM